MSQPNNPYVGPRPFTEQEQDRFFGRAAEIHILTDKILAHRFTLLVAASGVGKSSLLQAGVMPALRANGRVDLIYHNDWALDPEQALKNSLIKHLLDRQRIDTSYQADFNLPLAEFIHLHSFLCQGALVILLDQFEEFFYYQRFSAKREAFVQALAEAIQDSQTASTFVFAMREDFAMELQAFKPWFQGVFDNVYRIEKLSLAAAKEAICQPLPEGFRYAQPLLDELLKDLGQREWRERLELVQAGETHGDWQVEPPHLQIVCRELWNKNPAGNREITLAHYTALGKAPGILKGYFQQTIAELNHNQQKLASQAFDHLISRHGTKHSQPLEELAKLLEIDEAALQQTLDLLEHAAILRRLQRQGKPWYELYHDIFARSVDEWNQAYKQRQWRRKMYWRMGKAAITAALLVVAYDGYQNYSGRYLALGPESVSDRIEVFQGKPDSWDLWNQRRFLYETDYTRWGMEPDKRSEKYFVLHSLKQVEYEQMEKLPFHTRLSEHMSKGIIKKLDEYYSRLVNNHDSNFTYMISLLLQQRTLANFHKLKNLHHDLSNSKHLTDKLITYLPYITPKTERWAIGKLLLHAAQVTRRTAEQYYGGQLSPHEELLAAAKNLTRLDIDKLQIRLDDLGSPSPGSDMQQSVIEMLGQLGIQSSIPSLTALLDKPATDGVRQAAVESLRLLNAQTATPQLISLLDEVNDNDEVEQNGELRASVVKALGQMHAETAIPKLLRTLEDKNNTVLAATVKVLGQLKAKAAIPRLVELLGSSDNSLQVSAIKALAKIEASEAIPDLIKLLDIKNDDMVRNSVIQALIELKAKAAIPELVGLLDDKNPRIRHAAADGLGRFKAEATPSKIIAALAGNKIIYTSEETLNLINRPKLHSHIIDLLSDNQPTIRQAGAKLLGRLRVQTATQNLITIVSDDTDNHVRKAAVDALVQLNARAAIPRLIPLLDAKNNEVRDAVINALGEFKTKEVVPKILAILDDPYSSSRSSAIRALGRLNARVAIPQILDSLGNPDRSIQSASVEALGQFIEPAVTCKLVGYMGDFSSLYDNESIKIASKLISTLEDSSNDQASIYYLTSSLDEAGSFILQNIISSLANIKALESAQKIIKLLAANTNYISNEVLDGAIKDLAKLRTKAAIPALLSLLPEADVRLYDASGMRTLARLGAQAAIPRWQAMLTDTDVNIRYAAADALSRMGKQSAVPVLLKLLANDNEAIQQDSALALSRLSVQDPALAQWQDAQMAKLLLDIDEYPGKKVTAARQFAYIVTPSALAHLSTWLNEDNDELLRAVLPSLENIAAIQPQWLESLIPRLVELTRHEEDTVQQAAVQTLAQLVDKTAYRPAPVPDSIAGPVLQALSELAQDKQLSAKLRRASLDGLGGSYLPRAAQIIHEKTWADPILQLPSIFWLAELDYTAALPQLQNALLELVQEKQRWRQRVAAGEIPTDMLACPENSDKNWPKDYLVYQYAYAVARLAKPSEGIALLSHPLHAAREAAIQALAERARGDLAAQLLADMRAFDPDDLPSPRPYSEYRAWDLLLQQLEFRGNEEDLAALRRLGTVSLPMKEQEQAVNERLSWTITELQGRLDEQPPPPPPKPE